VPGHTRAQEALFAFCFGSLSIGVLGLVAYLAREPFLFPSLGPTAFLVFHRPTASAASPRNAIQGHLIGVVSGVAAIWIFGVMDAPDALSQFSLTRALAAGLSLGMTSALMVALDRGHPPAGATTLIVSLGLMRTPRQLLILMAAVVLLIAFGWLVHKVARTTYPMWAPSKPPSPFTGERNEAEP